MTIDSSNQREFPYEGIPEGWYQVAWSNEIEPGAVIPLRYFGTDLVLYRLETGELRLTGAYCPHMGAHLGYGGRVDEPTLSARTMLGDLILTAVTVRCPMRTVRIAHDFINGR